MYAAGIQPYSGLMSAWTIYWLGDSTGVLLVTPLVFTLPQILRIRSRARVAELGALVIVLVTACFLVFGGAPLVPVRLDVLAFAVIPVVMWGAISFGIAGATLAVFLIATIATILTALGHGPFSVSSPFMNAVLLDVRTSDGLAPRIDVSRAALNLRQWRSAQVVIKYFARELDSCKSHANRQNATAASGYHGRCNATYMRHTGTT